MMGKVVYHSFDFDGCFSNETSRHLLGKNWTRLKSKKEVNDAFLTANNEILSSFKSPDKTVLFIGSNRQTPHVDLSNGTGTEYPSGSVYPRMEAFAEQLGETTTFNPFVLSDLETDPVVIGQMFQKFKEMEYLEENGSYKNDATINKFEKDGIKDQIDDESKVSLVFAQMHLAAMENPDDEIEFNFYDDRKDIMERVQKFFKEYPELIPKNVTLNLKGYSGPHLTQEVAQEELACFIVHTTTNLENDATLKLLDEARTNNLPIFFKIPGEPEKFSMYRRTQSGEWGFADFDGKIPGKNVAEFSTLFPAEDGGKQYPSTSKNPEVFDFLKTQHFLPIPLKRKTSKEVYNYGEPTPVDSIKGQGNIPREIADWKPVYKAMREASMTEEAQQWKSITVADDFKLTDFIAQLYSNSASKEKNDQLIDKIINNKLQRLNSDLPPDEKEKLNFALLELYKAKIKAANAQLSSTGILSEDLRNARNALCDTISESLKSPDLTLEECQDLDQLTQHAHRAIETKDPDLQFKSICELGELSDKLAGNKSKIFQGVSVACGIFAVAAAFVAFALAPTGIGLIIGLAVAGALTAASIGAAKGAENTQTDISKKTHDFKEALEEIRAEKLGLAAEPEIPQNLSP